MTDNVTELVERVAHAMIVTITAKDSKVPFGAQLDEGWKCALDRALDAAEQVKKRCPDAEIHIEAEV